MFGIGDAASVLALVAAAGAAVAVAVVARQRQVASSVKPLLAVGLASFGLTAVLSAPVVIDLAVRVGWLVSAVYQVGFMLEMVGAFCLVAMLIRSRPSPRTSHRIRQHTALLIGCLVVMTALRLGATTPPDPRYDQPVPSTILAFIALRLSYQVVAITLFAVLAYRVSRQPETDPLVRWGLRITCGAAVIGFAYAGYTAWSVISGNRTVLVHQTAVLLLSSYVIMLAAGATATAWLTRLRAGLLHLRVWRTRRALRPLWTQLAVGADRLADTDSMTSPPAAGKEGALVDLLRTVIGIKDQFQVLEDHAHPQARPWARELAAQHGLDPDTSEVIATAAEVATALETVRMESPVGLDPACQAHTRDDADIIVEPTVIPGWTDRRHRARRATDVPPAPYQVPDILADSRGLLAILHALRHSSIVDTVRRRARPTSHAARHAESPGQHRFGMDAGRTTVAAARYGVRVHTAS